MTRLILAGTSSPFLLSFADVVVDFWFRRFAWGPLPSPDEAAVYIAPRTDQQGWGDHWLDHGQWRDRSKTNKNLGLIEFCRQSETVELWFDHTPDHQLRLIWLLDYFRSYPDIVARLRLRLCFIELIKLSEKFDESKIRMVNVKSAVLETASRAWQAYRAPTPEHCLELLTTDLSDLPLLRPALLELLAELPSATTGLGMTEMRMLELLAWGFRNTNALFHLRNLRATRIFNEWEHGYLLDGLAFGPQPAVTGLDEELRTTSREDLGPRHRAYLRSEPSLTEFGKAVVAHKEDFSRYNPIDRWWGGTHLTNDNLWRWKTNLVKPQAGEQGPSLRD